MDQKGIVRPPSLAATRVKGKKNSAKAAKVPEVISIGSGTPSPPPCRKTHATRPKAPPPTILTESNLYESDDDDSPLVASPIKRKTKKKAPLPVDDESDSGSDPSYREDVEEDEHEEGDAAEEVATPAPVKKLMGPPTPAAPQAVTKLVPSRLSHHREHLLTRLTWLPWQPLPRPQSCRLSQKPLPSRLSHWQ